MGKSAPSPPPQPDPYAVAAAQGTANKEASVANAWLGNVNEQNPMGAVAYTEGPSHTVGGMEVPTFNRFVSYTPEQQAILDQQQYNQYTLGGIAGEQAGRIGTLLGTPFDPTQAAPPRAQTPSGPTYFGSTAQPGLYGVNLASGDFSGIGDLQRTIGPTDYSEDRRRVEEAIYSRLEPKLLQDRSALETRLVNQGFQRGSEAFRNEMGAADLQANDARMQAILSGGGEQSRLAGLAQMSGQFANQATAQQQAQYIDQLNFNNTTAQQQQQFNNAINQSLYENAMKGTQFDNAAQTDAFNAAMQQAAYQNTSRAQGIQEMQAGRNQPLNEISALMSGSQVAPLQFQPYQYQPMNPAPVADSVYQSAALANQAYGQQMASHNAGMSGMFGLAGGMMKGIMGMSDRRLKKNIVDIGVKLANGLKLYAFDYVFGGPRQVGVMADEVEKVMPQAVMNVSGYGAVNYTAILRAA